MNNALWDDGKSKVCGVCGRKKLHAEFSVKRGKPSYRCKECHNAYYKDYYSKNSTAVKNNSKKYKAANSLRLRCERHGISVEKYAEMYDQYNGKCWVCLDREAEQIDHNHDCCPGKVGCQDCVRGLLCGPCNRMLGHASDNPEILSRAVEYLRL